MNNYGYKRTKYYSGRSSFPAYILFLIFFFICEVQPILAESSQPNPMGKSYVSIPNDLRAISWNPATLASIETNQIAVMSTAWESTIRPFEAKYLEYAHPIGEEFIVVACGGGILYVPESYAFAPVYPYTQNYHVMGAGAIQWPRNFFAGLSVGVVISNRYGIRYSAPDSAVLTTGLGVLWNPAKFFAFGTSFNWERKTIPDIPSPGSSYKLGFTLKPPKIHTAWEFSVSVPILKDKDEGFLLDTSLEGGPIPLWSALLSGRLGYTRKYKYGGNAFHKLRWISSGGTLKIYSFQVDYDFIPFFGDGNTHRISILYKFSGAEGWRIKIKDPKSEEHEVEEAAYKLAEYYYKNRQYYDSINSCQDVLQYGDKYPSAKDVRTYFLLAKNYLELKMFEDATTTLDLLSKTLESESFKNKLKDDDEYKNLRDENLKEKVKKISEDIKNKQKNK